MRRINLASERILHIINYLSSHFNKKYCYPSQNSLLDLLKRHHGIEISRRSLNYHLRFLEDNGFIHRVRRIPKKTGEAWLFKSTMYWLKKKAYGMLSKVAAGLSRSKYRIRKWWLENKEPVPASWQEPASPVGRGFSQDSLPPPR